MFWRLGSRRREAPRRRDRLLKAGVDPPGARVDGAREGVDVRPLQLVDLAVARDHARELVLLGELLEDRGVGRAPPFRSSLQHGELQVVEEDLLELVARTDGEVAPRDLASPRRRAASSSSSIALPEPGERLDVHEHAGLFHLGEHARQAAARRRAGAAPSPLCRSAARIRSASDSVASASAAACWVARSRSTSSNASCDPRCLLVASS